MSYMLSIYDKWSRAGVRAFMYYMSNKFNKVGPQFVHDVRYTDKQQNLSMDRHSSDNASLDRALVLQVVNI